MNTKNISTYKAGQQIDATHFLQVSTVPCKVFSIEGQAAGSGALYLQLMGVPVSSAVSGTTVPLWSQLITGGTGFSFVYPSGEDTSTMAYPSLTTTSSTVGSNALPVFLAISSTMAVWTSSATAVDATVSIDLPFVDTVALTLIKNDGNGGVLTLWADSVANTNKRMISLSLNNAGYGTLVYFQLFSFAPTAGALASQEWTATANQPSIELRFGDGFSVQQADASYVQHYGCFVGISSTPGTYTNGGTGNPILSNGTFKTIS